MNNIDAGKEYRVVAHELGHGQWKLIHSFADCFGEEVAATRGMTDNLMDYNDGTHIAKWQWDIMQEPAIFDGFLYSDEDKMMKINEKTDTIHSNEYNYSPYNLLLKILDTISNKNIDLQINTTKKVAIAPGHGDQHNTNKQIDPGSISDKDYEKDWALKISLEIRNRLVQKNVITLMTREDDIIVDGKRIIWRLEKAHKDSCDIFVSIHLNSSNNRQAKGFAVLYVDNDETSKKLAEKIVKKQTIMDIRGSGLEKRPKTGSTRVGVLCDFKGEASVLVEVGFISNQQDLELIKNKYKEIGIEIADGICEYLTEQKK